MRRHRPHQPGSTFHLTTRLHRREELFTPELRTALVGIIRDQLAFSDVDLLAYAIMPNHLHVVVRQGRDPLHRFMQPIIRRAAILVHRMHCREGHVFERRYRDRPCADPEHLRNAIVYTHLNPVRAGLCRDANDYAWTSHPAWLGSRKACDGRADPTAIAQALPLFASTHQQCASDLVGEYLKYIRWRLAADEHRVRLAELGSGRAGPPPEPPPAGLGDAYWLHYMTPRPDEVAPLDRAPAVPDNGVPVRADLADIAQWAMSNTARAMDLATLRSRWGGPLYVRARHAFIHRAATAGYKGVQIASYLHVTTQAVSKVLAAERKRHLPGRNAA